MNVREFPNSFESWNATALFFEGIGQKNEAIYYRTKSVELDPLNAEIKKLLASDRASN